MSQQRWGFTLVEMMIVLIVIGVLLTIGMAKYQDLVLKSNEGATRGNLGTLRSALSIYYGDNESMYPYDNLASLSAGEKYLRELPRVTIPPLHPVLNGGTAEVDPTDTGLWSYNNDDSSVHWGRVVVGCLHEDTRQAIWSAF